MGIVPVRIPDVDKSKERIELLHHYYRVVIIISTLELLSEAWPMCRRKKSDTGTDISKITRKPSKTGKHGHEKWKSTKEAKDAKPKAGKVKKSKLWSTLG
ncbi:hypothetical protein Tco_0910983 [Tanacetum coccineum]|uniref:Uncharacterized protein n=1 Tax=Tanacetum coccineum TaxID=301880 RepID=A0ABQ5CWN7_9ASTR